MQTNELWEGLRGQDTGYQSVALSGQAYLCLCVRDNRGLDAVLQIGVIIHAHGGTHHQQH